MDAEARVIEAIKSELQRQADSAPGELTISALPNAFKVSGRVDLEGLSLAVLTAMMGSA